jgi:hypothetical protein
MATLATPGIAIRRGRIVHLASVVSSTWSFVLEEMPILSTRLVDDSGESMTGAWATAGSRPERVPSRSCTICRARMRSVPSWKIRTTEERPSTDLDRMVLTQETPPSAFSMGAVMRLSTSTVERPGPSVCTSTTGGANSGKTSRGAVAPAR